MGTYTFTVTASNYYNSSNASGGAGYYLGNKRKVRMTINPTNANGVSWYASNLSIKEAYISIPLSGSYVNTDTLNIFYGTTSGSVGTVFPNKTDSGVVSAVQSIRQKCRFYPTKTYYFDITPIIKYAQTNWASSDWYLWYYTSNGNSTAVKFTAPTITVITEDVGSVFVYNGGWKPATPYIYDGSIWKPAVAHFYSGGWKFDNNLSSGTLTEYTYPTSSPGSRNSDYACSSSQLESGDSYYNAVHVLGYNTAYGWLSGENVSDPWIQIHLPYPTYDLSITITNSSRSDKVNGPITGEFLYTNTKGMAYNLASMNNTGITFSGRNGSTASAASTHAINNSYPIQNIIVHCTSWSKNNGSYCSIGKISITGKYFA